MRTLKETNEYATDLGQPTVPELLARIHRMRQEGSDGVMLEIEGDERFEGHEEEIDLYIGEGLLSFDVDARLFLTTRALDMLAKSIQSPGVLLALYSMWIMNGIPNERVWQKEDLQAMRILRRDGFVRAEPHGSYDLTPVGDIATMLLFNDRSDR